MSFLLSLTIWCSHSTQDMSKPCRTDFFILIQSWKKLFWTLQLRRPPHSGLQTDLSAFLSNNQNAYQIQSETCWKKSEDFPTWYGHITSGVAWVASALGKACIAPPNLWIDSTSWVPSTTNCLFKFCAPKEFCTRGNRPRYATTYNSRPTCILCKDTWIVWEHRHIRYQVL